MKNIYNNEKRLLHGGDYNPDQWLDYPDILKDDLRLMKLANVNTMTVGIFAWSALEPTEGNYNFEWLDKIIDDVYNQGGRVILATPSGARPAWLSEKYPEVLRTNDRREKMLHGGRHNHCFSSPIYREKTQKMNYKLAERYGNHPALIMWHVSNEYSGDCHCELCQENFRDWLKNKYKTIENVNKAWWGPFWSHTYTDWSQIESPSSIGENAVHGLNLDWKRFVTDQTIDFYENEVFDYCIIDEAQNIKNPKAQNTKVIKEINAKVKFALTGTPIENTIVELWSIFDFIMPGYLFDESSFKEKFMHRDEDELEELKILINPFILRRLKRDVISELPEKIEKKYYVQMTSDQRLAYKNYMKDVKLSIKNGEEDKVTIFSYLTRLRQICLDPSLVDENYNGKNGKINTAIDIIEDIIESKYKILVFSQFTSVLKKLRKELIERGIESKYLDGTTVAKERISLVNEFNESKEAQVFLISLKAGGTGLNLTSAKFVMHMDPWWNPAIEDQATDRAHRIGQKNIVEVIKLIAKDTIEENIIKLQEDKREIINSVISDDSLNINNISKLTNEEILDLFK